MLPVLMALLAVAEPKLVALTIDDLPFTSLTSQSPAEQAALFGRVLAALEKRSVRATGFVIAGRLTNREDLLRQWLAKGHVLGNHSFSHRSPHKLPLSDYLADVDRAHRALLPWIRGQRFYRYPFLQQGHTEKDREAIARHLEKLGYTIAHVSIDTDDWVFDKDYARATPVERQRIAADYLAHMDRQLEHYERRAVEVAGRPVRHVVLVHMNQLNAEHLGQVIDRYQARGYRFVPLEEVLKDPVYALPDHFAGKPGVSWLDRLLPIDPCRREGEIIEIDARLASIFRRYGFEGAFVLLDMSRRRLHVYGDARSRGRVIPASTFKIPSALIGLETASSRRSGTETDIFPAHRSTRSGCVAILPFRRASRSISWVAFTVTSFRSREHMWISYAGCWSSRRRPPTR